MPYPVDNQPGDERPEAVGRGRVPHTPHLALYRRLAVIFILLTLGIVGFSALVVFSRATVIVLSRQDEVKTDIILEVSSTPADGELSGGVLELDSSLSRSFPTTTAATLEGIATGRVSISSRLSRPQPLVATTRLLTADGRLYRLSDSVTVPGNGSVEVGVYADVPGPTMELVEGNFTIPGLQPDTAKLFTAEIVEPIGGSVRDIKLVTAADVEAAKDELRAELEQELTGRLRAAAQERGWSNTGESISFGLTEATTDVPVSTEAESFQLTMRLDVTGVFFDRSQLNRLVTARVRELTSFDRQVSRVDDQATRVSVEKLDLAGGRASVRVAAVGLTKLSPDSPALDPNKLLGISVAAAEEYLKQLPGVSSASVKVTPFWFKRLPNIVDNIKVEVR